VVLDGVVEFEVLFAVAFVAVVFVAVVFVAVVFVAVEFETPVLLELVAFVAWV
jgi:hypothetical protein